MLYDCQVTEHADGTIEATPIPESARPMARRREEPAARREPVTLDTEGEVVP